ncbi:MAG: hypothetical protein DRJ40_10860 [Thermoprotei archaeon]|nr:MAG: hypothetical protein DRJ40_10860 [Thermoprotei archaeon]
MRSRRNHLFLIILAVILLSFFSAYSILTVFCTGYEWNRADVDHYVHIYDSKPRPGEEYGPLEERGEKDTGYKYRTWKAKEAVYYIQFEHGTYVCADPNGVTIKTRCEAYEHGYTYGWLYYGNTSRLDTEERTYHAIVEGTISETKEKGAGRVWKVCRIKVTNPQGKVESCTRAKLYGEPNAAFAKVWGIVMAVWGSYNVYVDLRAWAGTAASAYEETEGGGQSSPSAPSTWELSVRFDHVFPSYFSDEVKVYVWDYAGKKWIKLSPGSQVRVHLGYDPDKREMYLTYRVEIGDNWLYLRNVIGQLDLHYCKKVITREHGAEVAVGGPRTVYRSSNKVFDTFIFKLPNLKLYGIDVKRVRLDVVLGARVFTLRAITVEGSPIEGVQFNVTPRPITYVPVVTIETTTGSSGVVDVNMSLSVFAEYRGDVCGGDVYTIEGGRVVRIVAGLVFFDNFEQYSDTSELSKRWGGSGIDVGKVKVVTLSDAGKVLAITIDSDNWYSLYPKISVPKTGIVLMWIRYRLQTNPSYGSDLKWHLSWRDAKVGGVAPALRTWDYGRDLRVSAYYGGGTWGTLHPLRYCDTGDYGTYVSLWWRGDGKFLSYEWWSDIWTISNIEKYSSGGGSRFVISFGRWGCCKGTLYVDNFAILRDWVVKVVGTQEYLLELVKHGYVFVDQNLDLRYIPIEVTAILRDEVLRIHVPVTEVSVQAQKEYGVYVLDHYVVEFLNGTKTTVHETEVIASLRDVKSITAVYKEAIHTSLLNVHAMTSEGKELSVVIDYQSDNPTIGSGSGVTPFTLKVEKVGESSTFKVTLTAPSEVIIEGSKYVFVRWVVGGVEYSSTEVTIQVPDSSELTAVAVYVQIQFEINSMEVVVKQFDPLYTNSVNPVESNILWPGDFFVVQLHFNITAVGKHNVTFVMDVPKWILVLSNVTSNKELKYIKCCKCLKLRICKFIEGCSKHCIRVPEQKDMLFLVNARESSLAEYFRKKYSIDYYIELGDRNWTIVSFSWWLYVDGELVKNGTTQIVISKVYIAHVYQEWLDTSRYRLMIMLKWCYDNTYVHWYRDIPYTYLKYSLPIRVTIDEVNRTILISNVYTCVQTSKYHDLYRVEYAVLRPYANASAHFGAVIRIQQLAVVVKGIYDDRYVLQLCTFNGSVLVPVRGNITILVIDLDTSETRSYTYATDSSGYVVVYKSELELPRRYAVYVIAWGSVADFVVFVNTSDYGATLLEVRE